MLSLFKVLCRKTFEDRIQELRETKETLVIDLGSQIEGNNATIAHLSRQNEDLRQLKAQVHLI